MTALLIVSATIVSIAIWLVAAAAARHWRSNRVARQRLVVQQQLDYLTVCTLAAMRAAARQHFRTGGPS